MFAFNPSQGLDAIEARRVPAFRQVSQGTETQPNFRRATLMDRGVFIDTGEGNEWADALRFLPWNADDRDGETFHNIAFASGRTSEGLRGGAPLVSPHTPATLQSALDAGEDGGKPDACRVIPDVLSLHSPTDTDEGQQDVI